jgi:predicted RecA/RadA family phage recombinase
VCCEHESVCEEGEPAPQEGDRLAGVLALALEHLGVGEPGMVVDHHVHELPARGAEAIATGLARLLERVVHEASTSHRLDRRADRLAIALLDPPGQGSQRVAVRRRGELVQLLSRLGEQADVDLPSTQIQPGVQH